ncbi:hypothetical protein [Microbacterium sp. BF1]|uniref:hypothetical protein n=1 Tax=Microbacterium sp. BF1 TaxID=2821146 RepID=UPI001C4DFFE5|nr:hypothetical protein [Microbacterium sp. BF1]
MKTSTSYLLGAIAFLLISAYLILSAEWAWHTVVTVVLTLTAGVIYTFYGVREKRKESAVSPASESE